MKKELCSAFMMGHVYVGHCARTTETMISATSPK